MVTKKVKVPDKARRQLEEMAAYAQSVRESNSYLDTIPRRFSRLLLPDEIRKVLDGRSRLIFSPHHLLHALPLHALTWDGDVLIRRFAVSYAPNLGCLLRRVGAAGAHGRARRPAPGAPWPAVPRGPPPRSGAG